MRTTQAGHTISHVHTSAGKYRFLTRKNGNVSVKSPVGHLDIVNVDGKWGFGSSQSRLEVTGFRTPKAAYTAAVKAGRI